MANLSSLTGGGVRVINRYTVTSPTSNDDFTGTKSITAVADLNKTQLNLTSSSFAGNAGTDVYTAIRLADSTTVEYAFASNGEPSNPKYITFEVIEYN